MDLFTWAKKWNIRPEALEDLILPHKNQRLAIDFSQSESAILNLVKKEASDKGCRLWRNNVGALHTADGNFLRYGLANESSQINKVFKSADLIGIRPIKITQDYVGHTIGQFVSREIKKSGWRYSGNEREKAQLNWAELILSFGGDACFAVSEGTL